MPSGTECAAIERLDAEYRFDAEGDWYVRTRRIGGHCFFPNRNHCLFPSLLTGRSRELEDFFRRGLTAKKLPDGDITKR